MLANKFHRRMRSIVHPSMKSTKMTGIRAVVGHIGILALLLLFAPLASAQLSTTQETAAEVGDAPLDPGPLDHSLQTRLHPAAVRAAMRKVADWQLAHVAGTDRIDWTFATLYLGFLAASDSLNDPRYRDFVRGVAEAHQWQLGPRMAHADDQAIGQSYLALNQLDPDPRHLEPLRKQFDRLLQKPDDPDAPVWWWCDALFMAPPVWAQLAATTGQPKYLDFMDREWHITDHLLWDSKEHLFSRDSTYLNKHERNGQKIFWSRGNGWVMGGLVRVLNEMPRDDPRRAFYETRFHQMADRIRSIQGHDGLWRPGLLDSAAYPLPEISGSSFFVYAMAWGIRTGQLDRSLYLPVVKKGWEGLVRHIYADGRLGSIQPVGASPDTYPPGASYVFGTGAFLLAGAEVAQLNP